MKKYVYASVFVLLSPAGFAAEIAKSDITYIAPWITHVDISMSAGLSDPQGCGRGDVFRIDLVNDKGANAKLSTLLAAFMAGKQVGLYTDGCVSDAPKILGVRLYK